MASFTIWPSSVNFPNRAFQFQLVFSKLWAQPIKVSESITDQQKKLSDVTCCKNMSTDIAASRWIVLNGKQSREPYNWTCHNTAPSLLLDMFSLQGLNCSWTCLHDRCLDQQFQRRFYYRLVVRIFWKILSRPMSRSATSTSSQSVSCMGRLIPFKPV
jgi:hypothetical protein